MSDGPMKLVDVFGVPIFVDVARRHSDNALVLDLRWGKLGQRMHSFSIPFKPAEALDFLGRFTAVTQQVVTEEENGKTDKAKG